METITGRINNEADGIERWRNKKRNGKPECRSEDGMDDGVGTGRSGAEMDLVKMFVTVSPP